MANNVTALQLSGSKKSKESDQEHTSEEKKKKQPESKGFRIPKKVCLCGYMYIIYLLDHIIFMKLKVTGLSGIQFGTHAIINKVGSGCSIVG